MKPTIRPTRIPEAAAGLLAKSGMEIWLPVVGDSMRPFLREGDRVAVRTAPFRPRFGDVALFRQVDSLVVHRLVGPVRGAGPDGPFRARGDGRSRLDPPVSSDALVGRVVSVEGPRGRVALDGPGARLWARATGLHALAWGGLVALAGRFGPEAERLAAGVDRFLLVAAHAALFRPLHRPAPPGPRDPAC